MPEATDEHLVAACVRGDAASWEALLDRYAALIYSVARKYGLSEADCADVFQSVCMTLLQSLPSVRTPRGLAAWLITTTSRQCLAHLRRRRREQSHASQPGAISVERVELPDTAELPEDELLALERQRQVRAAIRELTPNCRRLVEALFTDAAQQQTYQQLAAGLGMPMNSLGPTRARCLERLRRVLLAEGFVP